jgi:hydrogenase maturation protease
MKTLILGLGNPILGDDSIGWKVVETVKIRYMSGEFSSTQEGNKSLLEFECYSLGGLSLMENLIGYDRVWIIDAIHTSRYPVGTVIIQKLEEFHDVQSSHLASSHDMTLQTALELGRSIGAALPQEITVVGIEADINFDFSEELSTPLREAFPEVVNRVLKIIQKEVTDDLP